MQPPFEISEATYSYWTGGQPGVSGITILIRYDTDKTIQFDSIYFQSKTGYIENNIHDGKDYLIGRIDTSKPATPTINENSDKQPDQRFPFQLLQNEAVISYSYQNKSFYFKISNLKETDKIVFEL